MAKYRVLTSETVEKKIKKFAPHLIKRLGKIKENTGRKPIYRKTFEIQFPS